MGFRKGAFCRVFSVEPISEVNTKIRISVSKKNRQTGEYEQDFSGFVACIGSIAAKKAAGLKEGDRIKIGDCDVSNSYNKEKKIEYVNYKIFDFEMADGEQTKPDKPKVAPEMAESETSPNLPF